MVLSFCCGGMGGGGVRVILKRLQAIGIQGMRAQEHVTDLHPEGFTV